MTEALWLIGLFFWFGVLVYHAASRSATLIGLTTFIGVALFDLHWPLNQIALCAAIYSGIVLLFGFAPLRRNLLTQPFFTKAKKTVTPLTITTATEAPGEWEQAIFKGKLSWSDLLKTPAAQLSPEEIAFLDAPVNGLIQSIDQWDIAHNRHELPPKVWQRLKRDGFFGLTVPTEFGGHGFSNHGVMAILQKVAAVSDVVAQIINTANSLSATQLLIAHGTESQQQQHLPRIAKGDAITCLGLINPESGTDLDAISDTGIICEADFRGKTVLGIRLNWQKQGVHLAPVATEVAILTKIFDPQKKLGNKNELGLGFVLIPSHFSGISIGRRHASLDGVMPSGPCTGQNVFVPLEHVIGGNYKIGQAQQMLQGLLTTYSSVTLPACQLGRSKSQTAYTSAYARIRCHGQQPLSSFGGIAEKLASMAGLTYLIDAVTRFSVSQIKADRQPITSAAISKYQTTILAQQIINDGMEIQASKANSLGPRNVIAQAYQMTPENIAAGGGNILLRSAVIMGDAGLNCHPHFVALNQALQATDKKAGLKQYDQHAAAMLWRFGSNKARAFLLGISRGRLHWHTPKYCRRHFQALARLNSAFAIILDVSLLIFGDSFTKQQIQSGRLADCLGKLYLLTALLRNYHDAGQPKADRAIVDRLCQQIAYDAEQTMLAAIRNTPKLFWRLWLKLVVFPLGTICKPVADNSIEHLTTLITTPNEARDRLFAGLDFESQKSHPLHLIDHTWQRFIAVEPLLKRLYQGLLTAKQYTGNFDKDLRQGRELGLLTDAEVEMLVAVEADRREIIAIDDFSPAELNYLQRSASRSTSTDTTSTSGVMP